MQSELSTYPTCHDVRFHREVAVVTISFWWCQVHGIEYVNFSSVLPSQCGQISCGSHPGDTPFQFVFLVHSREGGGVFSGRPYCPE